MTEHDIQRTFFTWAEYQSGSIPELKLLHAIPNGGHRHKATAGKLKAEGVKAGVPDVCLPVARGGFHGCYLEFKTKKGRPTEAQLEWLEALAEQGYYTAIVRSFDEATELIKDYYLGYIVRTDKEVA